MTVRLPGGGARCYSLASSPHTGEPMKVTVKRVAGGVGSGWICESVAPGDELEVLPPAGTFTPSDLDGDVLLVAGGSGITPVVSIAKSALVAGRGRVALLYANRDEESVIFREELRLLGVEFAGRLAVVHWLETLQGLPTAAALRAPLAPYAGRDAYLCGPAPLMDAAEQALRAVGGRSVRRERYFSLGDDVFAEREDRAERRNGAEPDCDDHRLHVELDGEEREVAWPAGTPMLDALLAAGVDAPSRAARARAARAAAGSPRGGHDGAQRDPRPAGPRRGVRSRVPGAAGVGRGGGHVLLRRAGRASPEAPGPCG